MNIKYEYYISNFFPGFAMGITRSIISHPFEILKIKSQLNITSNINLFKGLHYSIISSGLERSIQFGLYDIFKEKNNSNLISSIKSGCLSTFISIPYNYFIVNKAVINRQVNYSINNLAKTIPIEYARASIGSFIFLYTYNEIKIKNYPLYLSAFIGTTTVWLITYPFDNIRNQIINSSHSKFNLKHIYNGIQYPIIRSIPSSIIGMYVYEKVKYYLTNFN